MRHSLPLAGASTCLIGLYIWGYIQLQWTVCKVQYIMGSHDWWEFLQFFPSPPTVPCTALMVLGLSKETVKESMIGLYLNGHDSYHDGSFWIPHLAMKQHTFPQNLIPILTVSWIMNNHDWSQNKVNGQNQIFKSIGISCMPARYTI